MRQNKKVYPFSKYHFQRDKLFLYFDLIVCHNISPREEDFDSMVEAYYCERLLKWIK